MESRRQKKVAKLIQKEVSEILLKNGPSIYGNAFVTVTDAKVTPDLLVARIYLSVMNEKNREEVLKRFAEHAREIRHQLGNDLRHQLRRIPELEFFIDESLDQAMRIEEIFKEINTPPQEGEDEK